MTYLVTEPHPTFPPTHRLHTGRGGAGNTYLTPPAPSSTSTSRPSLSLHRLSSNSTTSSTSSSTHHQPQKQRFSSGRGGAGNIKRVAVEAGPFYDFEDELQQKVTRERRRDSSVGARVVVGRGGAGNFRRERSVVGGGEARKASEASLNGSVRVGFFRRLSQSVF